MESDLTTAFCCRVCRKSDFQQLNGRNVGFIEVIVVISLGRNDEYRLDQELGNVWDLYFQIRPFCRVGLTASMRASIV